MSSYILAAVTVVGLSGITLILAWNAWESWRTVCRNRRRR